MGVGINLAILTIVILAIGYLFGGDSIAGFAVGFNLIGLYSVIDDLITGHSLRNAKFL